MYLKSLTLCGFKSFAQRTVFEFGQGLTAIVGPNGCGKSNVVDALKWVLGEQSAKSLRGEGMQDVIFNGSAQRGKMGFAEVTLTFADCAAALGVDYEEVSITRRLYRTNESEYFLNKTQCRRRDILELFMDTGVGVISYSIIEQGKIAALLTANAQQRRHLFEEAAGISRYKWKAKEAGRRLERVDLNLERLTGLVREVERQLGSLQRQAAKARRYQDLSNKLRAARIELGLHTYDRLHGHAAEVSGEIVALENTKAGLTAELGALATRLTTAELEQRDLQDRLRAADQTIHKLNSIIDTATHRTETNREIVQQSRERASQAEALSAAAREAAAGLEAELAAARAALNEARAAEGAATAAREGAEREVQTQEQARDAAKLAMRDAGITLDAVALEEADARTALTEATAGGQQLAAEQARLSTRRDELATQRVALDAEVETVQAQVTEIRRTLDGWKDRYREAEATRRQAEESVASSTETLDSARNTASAARSRHEVLSSVRENLEGVPAGAKDLLAQEGTPGLCGLLADRLEIDPADAPAIESALGHLAGGVICETRDQAWTLLDLLHERARGRGTLVPRDGAPAGPEPALPEQPGVIGWARTLVRCAPELEPLRDRLLAGVLVVADRATARRLSGQAHRIVTRQGELVDGDHLAGGPQGPGPLAARAELARLEETLAALETAVAEAEQARTAALADREAATRAAEDLRHRIFDGTHELQEYEARLAGVTEKRNAFAREIAVLGGELEQCEVRLAAAEAKRTTATAAIESCVQRAADARAALTAAKDAGNEADQALSAAQLAQADRRVAEATAREKRASAETAVPTLEHRFTDRTREAERQAAAATDERARAERAEAQIREDEVAMAAALNDRAQAEQGVQALQEDRRAADARVAAARTERDRIGQQREQVDQQLQELRVNEAKQSSDLEHLVAGLRADYDVDVAELHRDWTRDPAIDPEVLEIEVAQLQGKLSRIGGVNHDALDELTELEERHVFLTAQRDDLRSARTSLADIIRRINRKSREMFVETFETVRQNFQVLFRKLFGGGRADIVLEDESNPLESGIEIIARPPGKEPRSISLLSGGEKSMTCVGVVFAIYRSRPSPFCFLDEVDAALDEANIDRFLTTLKEFSAESQFLIITHRKPTMAASEAIYGVTMPEPGVSRPISMKLEEAMSHAEPVAAAPK